MSHREMERDARAARERGELRGHIARVCGRRINFYTGTEEKRGRSSDVIVHWLEVELPGGTSMRLEASSAPKTRRRALELFSALPDGAMSLSTKRAALLKALEGGGSNV